MRKAGGAAQAVALLLTLLQSSESEPSYDHPMRNCSECGGPVTLCTFCRHYHCDDETCPDYPIECAQEAGT